MSVEELEDEIVYPFAKVTREGWRVQIGRRAYLPGIYLQERDAKKAISSYNAKMNKAKTSRRKKSEDAS